MIKGFKDFLLRGNVVDLAVGIAIGVAFTTLVGAFGKFFIDPIVAVAGGNKSDGFGFRITDSAATFVNIGAIINALIVFVVTMAVIYFVVVVPMKKVMDRANAGKPAEAEIVGEDIALLREIRDSLASR